MLKLYNFVFMDKAQSVDPNEVLKKKIQLKYKSSH